jgi:hypothetical protein
MKSIRLVAAVVCIHAGCCLAETNSTPLITTNEFPRSDVVTVSDEMQIELQPDGSFVATRRARTQILTPRGRRAGDTLIPFNGKHQEVVVSFARAIQPDGSQSPLMPEEVDRGAIFPGHPAYSDVKVAKFRIRGANAGSLLDQQYVLKSKPVMRDHFWVVWKPRTGQPVLHAQLTVRAPASRPLHWKAHNADLQPRVVESDDKAWKTYTWTIAAKEELLAEPYMPPVEDFLPWVEITTVDAWTDVAGWLDSVCAPQVDTSDEIHSRVESLTVGRRSAAERIAAIFYWIEDNFRFVSVELGVSGYRPRPASQTFQSRYGDAKDLCVLLAAMLQDAGIPSRIAFLESGSARPIRDRLPMPRHLTHAVLVVEAEGKTWYLDPTAETARFDVILGRLCNTELVLLGKSANQIVPGPTYEGSNHGTREAVRLTLAADGSVRGQSSVEYFGESDAFIRAELKYAPGNRLRELLEDQLKRRLPGARVLEYDVGDVGQRDRNFTVTYRFEAPSWAAVEGDRLRFKPQLLQTIEFNEELFGTGERRLPFQFYETAPATVEIEIALPDEFVVETVPAELKIENAFSLWTRSVRQDGRRLLVSERSHLKTARLPAASVEEVRQYYREATARKQDEVVLKKK